MFWRAFVFVACVGSATAGGCGIDYLADQDAYDRLACTRGSEKGCWDGSAVSGGSAGGDGSAGANGGTAGIVAGSSGASADAAGCTSSQVDCNGSAVDGCEVDLSSSADNCGVCGRRCNTVPGCSAGACALGTCVAGFGDCNGVASDGCELDLTSGSGNCGACGRDCRGTSCANGACTPTVFYEQPSPFISSLAVSGGYVYWTSDSPSEIRRAPVAGGSPERASPSPSSPYNLMADSSGIYWTALNGDSAGTVLKCASPPCSSPTVLATASSTMDNAYRAIADASRIYWSSNGAPPVMRSVPKTGGSSTPLVQDGARANRAIVVASGVLYYTYCCGASGGVYSIPTSGGTPSQLNSVWSGPLAVFGSSLFATNGAKLQSMPTNGGTPVDVPTGGATADGALAVDSSGVYFMSTSLGGIARVPTSGGTAVLLSRAQGVVQFNFDSTSVYWVENAVGPIRSVKKVAK